jgi:hypothetical protein
VASGIVFFVYAVGLVLGVHFDPAEAPAKAIPADEGNDDADEADRSHPIRSGFRAMLLPFVVSPLAVAADLEVSLSADDWGARWVIAGAFALVVVFDALCAVVFAWYSPRCCGGRTRAFSKCSPGCSASCSRPWEFSFSSRDLRSSAYSTAATELVA